MAFSRAVVAAVICVGVGGLARATEPNETFSTATLLAPGVLTVSDELTASIPPDTVLGARDVLGGVYLRNDDDSRLGAGTASELTGVATNSGSVDFVISGFPDENFIGDHAIVGGYRVYVDVFDFFEDKVASFSEDRTLQPGEVHEYSFSDAGWIGGTYDVYIDNTIEVSGVSDVDFFTFSGLTPGTSFAAETLAPGLPTADTILGWYGGGGAQLANDDDSGPGLLSWIAGVVPAGGQLTFAVTGAGDWNFAGEHAEQFPYQLQLTLGSATLVGDFNRDNVVNAADLAAWKTAFAAGAGADADNDGDSDGADFLRWQQQFGVTASTAALAAVPEPTAAILALWGLAGASGRGFGLWRAARKTHFYAPKWGGQKSALDRFCSANDG